MNRDPLKNIIIQSILLMILSISIIELIDGIMTMKFGFSYLSTFVRLLFLVLPLLLIMYLPVKKGSIFVCLISFILLLMFLRLLRSDITAEAVIFDFQYTARSILLLISIFLFGYILKMDRTNVLLRKYFPIQWVVITSAVLLHISTGIGGTTYYQGEGIREGYTSFFQSGNQITYLYVVSWWFLVAVKVEKLKSKVVLSILTLFTLLAIGTRAGVLLVTVMSCLYIFKKIYEKSVTFFLFLVIILVSMGIFVLTNFNYVAGMVARLFIMISSEASHLVQNVNTYGALTALVSRRDILIQNAMQVIGHYDFKEILIGPNFFNYKKAVGSYTDTREIRMAEVDPVDLFGGFGIIGVLIIYLPTIWIFLRLLRKWRYAWTASELPDRMLPAVQGGIFISILASSLSGHVFLSPLSILTVGLILSMAWHLLKRVPVTPAPPQG